MGESAAEEISRFIPVALPLPHVRPARNVWPVMGKDSLGKKFNFNLSDALMSCPF